jgi:hypothetical protein
MSTSELSNGIIMHQSHNGMKCMGDDTGCANETAVFYRTLKSKAGSAPLSDIARLRVSAYLKHRDGDVLVGTNFIHLLNVEENEFKTWCPMARFALECVPSWTVDEFESKGLVAFLTALVSLCTACGKHSRMKCSRCKRSHYCSRTCQRSDWNHHKTHCGVAR